MSVASFARSIQHSNTVVSKRLRAAYRRHVLGWRRLTDITDELGEVSVRELWARQAERMEYVRGFVR